jgi:hypothetical protein
MSDSATYPVERRLRRLEQQWRAVRATAALGMVIAVAAATTAFGRRDPASLRTGRLELTDSLGKVRATLGAGQNAAAWTLVDSTGRMVAALTLEESGQIAVRDGEGRVQAILGPATVQRLTER